MAEGIAYCQMIFEDGKPKDWIYLSVNPAFESQTGLVEITGKKVTEAIPGIRETDPELFEIYGRVASTGHPEKFETYVEALQIWFSVSVYSPRMEYFVAVFNVITERKQAEEVISRLAKFPSENPNPVLRVDDSGVILYANQASAPVLRLWDREVGQAVPSSWQTMIASALQTGQNLENEIACGEKLFSASLAPVVDHGYVNIYASDVTERKRAEEDVFESQRQMEALVTSLDDIVFELDERGTYLNVWTADENMLFEPKDQLLGREMKEVLGKETGRQFIDALGSVLTSGDPANIEYPLEVGGSQMWFMGRLSLIHSSDPSNKTVSMLVRDITEKKLAEREIQRHNEELKLINDLNEVVNRGEDIDSINALFAHRACQMFACRYVAIYLISADGKFVEMQSSSMSAQLTEKIEHLIGRSFPKMRIPLKDGGYFKEILAKGQGTITSDPQAIQRWLGEFANITYLPPELRDSVRSLIPQLFEMMQIRAILSIPMVSSGRTIGLLEMLTSEMFTDDDLQRMQVIGPQITAVIQRILAEEQVQRQRQLQRLRALSEIDRAISSSLDMRFSLDILINEARSLLGVDAVSVMLLNETSLNLEHYAGKGFRSLGILPSHLHVGEGLAGHVGLERKLLHIPNLAEAELRIKRPELLNEEQFVEYIGIPLVAKGMLKGVLEIFQRAPLSPDSEWLDFLETLAGQAAIAVDSAQTFEGLQRSNFNLSMAYDATIEGWSRAMDLRDKDTEGHTLRVTEMTLQLAEKMDISQQDRVHIRRGALLHDIGKLGVPDQILHKPGPLTDEEWVIMRQHPQFAHDMLASIEYLRPALNIPYCHHEMWDGKGYPRGLSGEQIPVAARLFAVVDVWDALRSDRPYRQAWSQVKALEHIKSLAGTHFDPMAVELFMQVVVEMEAEKRGRLGVQDLFYRDAKGASDELNLHAL